MGQRSVVQVRVQARYQHRRRGCQELRIDDFQQALREARKFGVQLQLYTTGQESKAFEQTFYVGVGDFQALHTQARCDLREGLRKFGTHLTQVAQFFVVVAQQPGVHGVLGCIAKAG